ncbi:MAG: glycoside hydrolase family 130 protein [Lentisphaerota bacterium]
MDRSNIIVRPNNARVIIKAFYPPSEQQAFHIMARILMLSEDDVTRRLTEVFANFSDRHLNIQTFFETRFEQVRSLVMSDCALSRNRRLLIGAYFSHEYSLEASALFNPSMVPHPDQSGIPEGSLRFILSLRSTGEGHISSITFRSGVIDAHQGLEMDPPSKFAAAISPIPNAAFDKALFARKLQELGLAGDPAGRILASLNDSFTFAELEHAIQQIERSVGRRQEDNFIARGMQLLARSNYEVEFPEPYTLSERVLFPASPSQINGIEDARFVPFRERDGSTIYYATYTAYDGKIILPQLLETRDFRRFKFSTLNGTEAKNKGMALFPRMIRNLYAMIARVDGENLSLMYSDNLHFWYETRIIARPTFTWETIQIGNCGSPIETERGWLLLTHGVGPMRKYCIGAILLDLEDPSLVIGRLRDPLIMPREEEREGYVPNVVYTCGCLLHAGTLFIPYGIADHATTFATVPLDRILKAMTT